MAVSSLAIDGHRGRFQAHLPSPPTRFLCRYCCPCCMRGRKKKKEKEQRLHSRIMRRLKHLERTEINFFGPRLRAGWKRIKLKKNISLTRSGCRNTIASGEGICVFRDYVSVVALLGVHSSVRKELEPPPRRLLCFFDRRNDSQLC